MKHATQQALERLAPLLEELAADERLRQKSPGVFYLKSKAFLHFHEDPAGLFADVRFEGDWERYRVTSKAEWKALVSLVRSHRNAAAR